VGGGHDIPGTKIFAAAFKEPKSVMSLACSGQQISNKFSGQQMCFMTV
jgi:hypothetical protein